MYKLLRADFYRMYHNKRIWLCIASMIGVSIFFSITQYTAMDYSVPLSRVIFLPLTFYGIAIAALISFYIGEDFGDGVIRNKVVAGRGRCSIYVSNLICGLSACLLVYVLTTVVTVAIGINYFEKDVTLVEFGTFFALGLFTSLVFGSIYGMLSLLIGNKSTSIMVCMCLAFGMLCLCLHTNQILVQQQYKDGILNLHYVSGAKRVMYEFLHDINPFGQIAQLSSMTCLNWKRWVGLDILWIVVAVGLGNVLFQRKNIR